MIYSLYPLLKVVSGISLHPYSKEANQLTINASEGSALYDKLIDILDDQDSPSELKTVKNSLEKISAELSPKMPTSLKDVNIVLLNPLNSNLDLYIASEGEVTYDYIKENDD
ncbi:hypothetical protein [Lacticaseibacillus paracasei]|uniref:hypothetical protein n=1 Tax=Lacticaseibacillus paracasei TaxID=1597 RepID=UPI002A59B88B|nr:hypothetical protein [Lacticaseibacillus paracasei]MDY0839824.1 hypothetical protein [Lacticaseibacillus paracasei]